MWEAKGREVEEAAIDCKNITTRTIVPSPLYLKDENVIHVKKCVF